MLSRVARLDTCGLSLPLARHCFVSTKRRKTVSGGTCWGIELRDRANRALAVCRLANLLCNFAAAAAAYHAKPGCVL